VTVYDIPERLRTALISEVEEEGVSATDRAAAIIAGHIGHPYKSTGRGYRFTKANPLVLKLPDDLWVALRIAAARSRTTYRGLVILALERRYGNGAQR